MKNSILQMSVATEATRTEITTDSGEKIPFDFLVICTGSLYVGPRTKQERIVEYQTGEYAKQLVAE
jgi:NAD(P)H-nitrite reductase large subunit